MRVSEEMRALFSVAATLPPDRRAMGRNKTRRQIAATVKRRAERAEKKQGALCAVPGCENRLAARTKSGVCREHNHAHPYCRCARCLK